MKGPEAPSSKRSLEMKTQSSPPSKHSRGSGAQDAIFDAVVRSYCKRAASSTHSRTSNAPFWPQSTGMTEQRRHPRRDAFARREYEVPCSKKRAPLASTTSPYVPLAGAGSIAPQRILDRWTKKGTPDDIMVTFHSDLASSDSALLFSANLWQRKAILCEGGVEKEHRLVLASSLGARSPEIGLQPPGASTSSTSLEWSGVGAQGTKPLTSREGFLQVAARGRGGPVCLDPRRCLR